MHCISIGQTHNKLTAKSAYPAVLGTLEHTTGPALLLHYGNVRIVQRADAGGPEHVRDEMLEPYATPR